jgi:hypothetical protein
MGVARLTEGDRHTDTPVLRCSFCNKSQRHVKKLIAGPSVYICDECVEVCNAILDPNPEVGNEIRDAVEALLRSQQLGEHALASSEQDTSSMQSTSGPPVYCSLCIALKPLEKCISVPERGLVCRECCRAVNEAVAISASI